MEAVLLNRDSAILTVLQIQGAANDPLTRYLALFSLICALISLLFGCMYIIRFGTMRKTYKAAEWALVGTFNADFFDRAYELFFFFRKPKSLKQSSGGTYGCCWQCLLFGSPGMCAYRSYVMKCI